jgi:hypothetical protein
MPTGSVSNSPVPVKTPSASSLVRSSTSPLTCCLPCTSLPWISVGRSQNRTFSRRAAPPGARAAQSLITL